MFLSLPYYHQNMLFPSHPSITRDLIRGLYAQFRKDHELDETGWLIYAYAKGSVQAMNPAFVIVDVALKGHNITWSEREFDIHRPVSNFVAVEISPKWIDWYFSWGSDKLSHPQDVPVPSDFDDENESREITDSLVLSLFKIDHSNLRIERTGVRVICVVVRDEQELFEKEGTKEDIGNHILRERKAEEKVFGVPVDMDAYSTYGML